MYFFYRSLICCSFFSLHQLCYSVKFVDLDQLGFCLQLSSKVKIFHVQRVNVPRTKRVNVVWWNCWIRPTWKEPNEYTQSANYTPLILLAMSNRLWFCEVKFKPSIFGCLTLGNYYMDLLCTLFLFINWSISPM